MEATILVAPDSCNVSGTDVEVAERPVEIKLLVEVVLDTLATGMPVYTYSGNDPLKGKVEVTTAVKLEPATNEDTAIG